MKRTKEQIIELIYWFEQEMGESFNDYFSHDNIVNSSWAFWLLGKGYTEHATILVDKMAKEGGNVYIDQEELYNIYPDYVGENDDEWSRENYEKNTEIMADFLSSSKVYQERFEEFISKWQKDDEE